METVNFYYAIGSRYSYLAATQINRLQQKTGCHVEWQPINSVRLISQRERSPFDGQPVSGQYEWDYRELDAKRWADLYGVPYYEPRGRVHFDSELLAKACTVAKHFGKVAEYSCLLFAAMFQDAVAKTIDQQDCLTHAESCGIAAADFRAVLAAPETVNRLDTTINQAAAVGVFGVPTFVTTANQLFWGNDRLVLLRHHLDSLITAS
jgi:2-hydroxychromene-2-carboxylate isomerase